MKTYGLTPELPLDGDWCTVGLESGEPEEWLMLGRLTEYGQKYPIRFDVSQEKVVGIFGKRGQGKSYTLGSLVEPLVTQEQTNTISSTALDRAVLIFDTLNIFQWMNIPLLEGFESEFPEIARQRSAHQGWEMEPEPLRVNVWSPAGYRHALSPDSLEDLFLNVSDFDVGDWGALLDLDIVRDIKGQLLNEVHEKVTTLGWTHSDGTAVAAQADYAIGDMIGCVENDQDLQDGVYRPETCRALLQQLRAYQRHPVFSGVGTPLNQLLIPGTASVLLLGRLPPDLRGILVGTLVRRILDERADASETAKDLAVNPNLDDDVRRRKEEALKSTIPKTWIVVDEAQNVLPSERKTSATEALVRLVKEGRNYGLSFVVTTQQPRSLDARVMSQVETFISHKLVSQADIDYVLENLKCPLPERIRDRETELSARELLRDVGVGQAFVSDANTKRCFVMAVRPRVSVHGGFEA